VPRDGVLPLSPTLDSVGPLAPSVACCAIMDAVLAGEPAPPAAALRPAGLRLVMPANYVLDGMDAPTERAIDRAVQRLDRAGVAIDRVRIAAFDQIFQANARGGFAVVEAYSWHRALLARDRARYDQRVAARMLPGADMSAVDYFTLLQARARIIDGFAAEIAPYDALLMPTVPIAPPPIAAFAADADYVRLNGLILRNSSLINFVDGCAISLPCHEQGAPPAALTLAGPPMADRRLLAIAAALETILAA
jgi:aspartyl-tRNA(Asn)/glutamyl-tRNA(Gln) amidotransferase subunit A